MQLSTDGSTFQDIRPADVVERRGLQGVAGELDWVYEDEDVSEDEDEIKETVLSMLSVFEPQQLLPGELKCPESPLTSERSRRYQKLVKLLTEYAIRDPRFLLQLGDIIDNSFQGRVFFEKIDNLITQTFNALDDYIEHGSTGASVDALHVDVPTTANKLTSFVAAIHEFAEEQDEDDAVYEDVAIWAAAALVRILDLVTDRNINAYENITWGIPPESPSDNNLYYRLIGEPAAGTFFVLNALYSLPREDVTGRHWSTLKGIERKLVQHNAPANYLTAFRQVVYDGRKRAASESRGGEIKRTAS